MMLPPMNVMPAYDDFLRQPPHMANVQIDNNLHDFATYFESTWLHSAEKITQWNHWSNTGPRTTNVAEGFNNSLRSKFPVRKCYQSVIKTDETIVLT